MADNSLKDPVIVRAISLNASSLPKGYTPAYEQYILSQALDFTNVAGKANDAGQGAYDAQKKNDDQDLVLSDHESRIAALRVEVDNHEVRITSNTSAITSLQVRVTTAEGNITTIQGNITSLTSRVTSAEGAITLLQSDYVSKSAISLQSLSSPLSATTFYSVNGTQVVGTRKTGWTAATGTAYRGSFNSDPTMPVGATYSQSEVQAIANNLTATLRRLKALEDDIRSHGLIN